jgi:hypothetical protein
MVTAARQIAQQQTPAGTNCDDADAGLTKDFLEAEPDRQSLTATPHFFKNDLVKGASEKINLTSCAFPWAWH